MFSNDVGVVLRSCDYFEFWKEVGFGEVFLGRVGGGSWWLY